MKMLKVFKLSIPRNEVKEGDMQEVPEINEMLEKGYELISITAAPLEGKAMFLVVLNEPNPKQKFSYAS